MATTFSNKPWDGDAARFTPEQWRASCLIDTGEGDPDSKGRYKLPIKEPSGAVNTNAVGTAAAALAGARGNSVQAPPAAKKAAARKLLALYGEMKKDAPATVKRLAGQ